MDINGSSSESKAKFEPNDGHCLLFIGQDMHAIGGLKRYNDGYCDYFPIPSGITLYTNFSPGDESYGHINRGNDGIRTIDNWGAGDSCAQCYVDHPDFEYSAIAIGLSFVNHEKKVALGDHDPLIEDLADWIKSLGQRPVFLRLGYEFDGWEWNNYKKKHYLGAWRRVHSIMKAMKVSNVAFVWQSKGTGTNRHTLEAWYPGDDLVDWCGYSYFARPDQEMITFARRHGKPVFIAEATPVIEKNNSYYNARLTYPKVAEDIWSTWFIPLFHTICENEDVIKALSYINIDWAGQPMWANNPVFKKVDSRIQVNEFISEKWVKEIEKPRYLKYGTTWWRSK